MDYHIDFSGEGYECNEVLFLGGAHNIPLF